MCSKPPFLEGMQGSKDLPVLTEEVQHLRWTCWGAASRHTYVGEPVDRQDAVAQRLLVAHAHQERQDDLVPGRLVPLLQVPARDMVGFASCSH